MHTIYDYSVLDFSGNEKSLHDYAAKVVLIVNTASTYFFKKQFNSLEHLYLNYKNHCVVILAFPSNDFFNQKPRTGHNLEIYCRLKQQITFPVFKRIHVRGDYAHPLYRYLYSKKMNGKLDVKPFWNFHKYLINNDGELVDHFYPFTSPLSTRLENSIQKLLSE